MFGQFFNIDESAFSIAPNPKYLYLSKQHEEALAHLVYGITCKGGFVLLTGDIGTGKTTICRCMFEQLPENTDIAFVINPQYSPLELLSSICDELHIAYSTFHPNVKDFVKKLFTYLIDAHAKGRNTVLVIDEAQNLSIDALEHIRALTNIETNELKLLQIILIGQPELRGMLARPELEQVNQRITARFHIGPLNMHETNKYISHRLSVAGATQAIFSSANVKLIFRLSRGVPRLINILCDRVLLGAYTLRQRKINAAIIKQSAAEVFDHVVPNSGLLPKAVAASLIALLVSGVLMFAFQDSIIDSLNILRQDIQQSLLSNNEKNHKEAFRLANEKIELPVAIKNVLSEKHKSSPATANENQELVIAAEIEKDSIIMARDELANTKVSRVNESNAVRVTGHAEAFRDLFRLWGIDYSLSGPTPCEQAVEHELYCYQSSGTITELAKLNRPVILKSHAKHYGPSYLVMVSVDDEKAVVSENDEYRLVLIADIESNWSGEFEMLWRPLHSGVSHILPGQKGEAIVALEKKLAHIEGRQPELANPFIYSSKLVNQVKTFQVTQNITADGIVGPITQIHINNVQHANVPYLVK